MTCQERRLQISEYLDGAMRPSQVGALLLHTETCGSCREFFLEQKKIADYLQAADWQLQPPAQLWDRIESRISPAAAAAPRPSVWTAWLAPPQWGYALAASLALAILSVSLFLGSQPLNRQLLAELNAYQVDVPDNPFLAQPREVNPFFEPLDEFEGNPFDPMRSPK